MFAFEDIMRKTERRRRRCSVFRGAAKKMNIIIGCVVIIAALYLKLRFRPEGTLAKYLFGFSVLAGIVSMLTVESYATVAMMLWPVVDIILSGLILRNYQNEVMRQVEAREARVVAQRRAAIEHERRKVEMARRRSRASVYAICGSDGLVCGSESAAA